MQTREHTALIALPSTIGGGSSVDGRARYTIAYREGKELVPAFTVTSAEFPADRWRDAVADAYAKLDAKLTERATQ